MYREDAWTIPVVILSYLPVREGRVDRRVTGDVDLPLDVVRRHIATTTDRAVAALERGSAYHGYKRDESLPCLRYQVVGELEFLEPLPAWPKPGHTVPMTDYSAIMDRIGAGRLVAAGVKEFWLWGYHGGVIDLWESNMAGPWGDISNSDRDHGDLPVFDRTYTVYHYNYGRGASEAVEDHMHQLEAVLNHAGRELFWERFVGKTGEGRCGWSHIPPNGERDYDWANPRRIASDLEDWRPGGGERQLLDSSRWGRDSLTWFTYWMQNIPGADNGVDDRGRRLGNWWRWIGDFDGAMASGDGLFAAGPA